MQPFTLVFIFCLSSYLVHCNSNHSPGSRKLPSVLIVTLIRNKAHTLPYFWSYLENLDYPKNRISLWFRSDHNADNSIEITKLWLNRVSSDYHEVSFLYDQSDSKHPNETSSFDWPKDRFLHIIRLKEEAMLAAEKQWADFIFFLDADVFLTNKDTLKHLTSLDLPIVAPMLLSEGLYSNFWGGMSDKYYYQRTDEYKEIYHYKKIGIFPVPMVHSAVLINLNIAQSNMFTFDRQKLLATQKSIGINEKDAYKGPIDDIIIFAISANSSGATMFVCNEEHFGYILQPVEDKPSDLQQLMNIKLNIINDLSADVLVNDEFRTYITYPTKDKLSLDQIYMINLERRPERRRKMEISFNELGLDVVHFPAVDGKKLNLRVIKEMGIQFLEGYEDPYHHRQMTMGEIGCFLSHYGIWEKIVELSQKEVLILEDDIRFEPYFKERALSILEQARNVGRWDIMYFGRKRLEDQDEPWVEGTEHLVHVGYSYWTLGYVITLEGARKLIDSQPLTKILPVDEYLPIMFDRHPNDTWRSAFQNRNLLAYSAAPLILFPSRYTGESGYSSDTEDSFEIPAEKQLLINQSKKEDLELLDISNEYFQKHTNEIYSEMAKSMSRRDESEL